MPMYLPYSDFLHRSKSAAGIPSALEAVKLPADGLVDLVRVLGFAAEDERHVVPATHHFGAKGIVDQPLVVQFSVKRGALPGHNLVEDLIEDLVAVVGGLVHRMALEAHLEHSGGHRHGHLHPMGAHGLRLGDVGALHSEWGLPV